MPGLLKRAPIIRILLPFALGIAAGLAGHGPLSAWAMMGLALLLLLLLLLLPMTHPGPGLAGPLTGLLSVGISLAAGAGSGYLEAPRDPGLPEGERVLVMGRMRTVGTESGGRITCSLNLRALYLDDSLHSCSTTIQCYLPVKDSMRIPRAGECWFLRGTFMPIRNSGNPGEVDWEAIYRKKSTWYRFNGLSASPEANQHLRLTFSERASMASRRMREGISCHWGGSPQVKGLLQALCLGDKDDLHPDTRANFGGAGAMHILAVSGLHVGLVWWVLSHVLAILKRWSGREWTRALCILILLWCYAWLTGLGSSVSRSVCMFSIFTLARLTQRPVHSVNVVLLSMFLLLLVQPQRLLDVGFQLSYGAVLAIVGLHPILSTLWRPRHFLLRWLWNASLVSLAAQLGTLPLVLHYFSSLPLYGLLSNLIALPLLSLIVGVFVCALPFTAWEMASRLAGRVLGFLGEVLHQGMGLVSDIPGASVTNLGMDRWNCLLALLLLWSAALCMRHRRALYLCLLMAVCSVILLRQGHGSLVRQNQRQVQVSHFRGGTHLAFVRGEEVDHYFAASDSMVLQRMKNYAEQAWSPRTYQVTCQYLPTYPQSDLEMCSGKSASHTRLLSLKRGSYLIGSPELSLCLLLGGDGQVADPGKGISTPAFVLCSHEPRLRAFTEGIPPGWEGLVVVDGSNAFWYAKKLRGLSCRVFETSREGALVLSY